MRRSLLTIFVLMLAFSLVLVPCLYSQAKKDTKTGQEKFDGTVITIDKEKSTLTLRQTGGTAVWTIVWTKDTTFTYRNEPSTVAEVKEGRRCIILGTFEKGSTKMTATRIDVREGK